MTSSPYFIISICTVDMNVYARLDEIPSMTLKRYQGNNVLLADEGMHRQNENCIYPPTNTVRRVKIIHVAGLKLYM